MSNPTSLSFNILTKELGKVLSICNQISLKKSDVELFTLSRVALDSAGLHIFCTNGSVFYNTHLKLQGVEQEHNLVFLVKTDQFSNIISIMNDESLDINIDLDKHTLVMQGSKSKHQIRITTENIESYLIPELNAEKAEVKFGLQASQLIEANKAAKISVGLPKNMYNSEFLNICYTVVPETSKLYVVSTDRFRITKNTIEATFDFHSDKVQESAFTNYLLPPKNLDLLASSISDEGQQISVTFEQDLAFFEFENSQIISRFGEGKYAEYEKIIPQSFGCSFTTKTAEFLAGLKQVYWCIRNDIVNHSVNVKVNPNEKLLTFTTKNSDGDEAQSEVNMDSYEGNLEEWNQSFNADYLMDYISIIKTETFLWESNPGKPAVLSPKDIKDKQFYLVSGLK